MQQLFCLALLLTSVLADYYQLLGITRNANEETIKKAFKKMSLKFHPDKNRGNEANVYQSSLRYSNQAQEQFQKVVNAYEVLKDPEQRNVYDRYGEEGLKQHSQQQQQQHNYNDMYSQFFGHGHGGGFQGQGNLGQSLFSGSDVYEIDLGSISRFFRREEVWLVLFYRSDQKGKQYQETWKQLASQYYGIFRVGSINCNAEEELCGDEFQIYEYPSVWAFPSNIRQEPTLYKGDLDVKQLARFGVGFMESFVSVVTGSNYQEFVGQDRSKNKLLLFTNKKSTPPLFKALSKDLKGRLIFGQIRESESELVSRFGVNRFPTIMVLTDGEKYEGVVYESNDFKKDQIMKFLREYAYTSSRSSKSSSNKLVRELNRQQFQNGYCTNVDKLMCFVLITDENGIRSEQMEMLEQLNRQYSEDPIQFYYMKKSSVMYSNVFGDLNVFPAVVVLKSKKQRYAQYGRDMSDMQQLSGFVDEILGGSIQFSRMNEGLEGNIFNDDL